MSKQSKIFMVQLHDFTIFTFLVFWCYLGISSTHPTPAKVHCL